MRAVVHREQSAERSKAMYFKYISGGVEFVAGKDASGYWLFFVEV